VDRRRLGRSDLRVAPIGFGAVKIGRNRAVKYPRAYALPDDAAVAQLLHGVVDAGINLIDTAPAYGDSEALIGRHLSGRREEIVLCTKVGERFEQGRSTFDFSAAGMERSITNSLRALRTDAVDLLLLHSDGRDLAIMEQSDAVEVLLRARERGLTRCIGLSGKTLAGGRAALAWADVLMLTYHRDDVSQRPLLDEARTAGVGVLVKKALASGHLDAASAIAFATAPAAVGAAVIGSLNLEHMRRNLALACATHPATCPALQRVPPMPESPPFPPGPEPDTLPPAAPGASPRGPTVILLNRHGEVLLVLRDDKPEIPYPNTWALLGGYIEPGETPEQALRRELREEIGVELAGAQLFREYRWPECTEFIFWHRLDIDPDATPLNEGQRLAYFRREQLAALDFASHYGAVLEDFFASDAWRVLPAAGPEPIPEPKPQESGHPRSPHRQTAHNSGSRP
jgi:mutator protein MutT